MEEDTSVTQQDSPRSPRAEAVNKLSKKELGRIIEFMKANTFSGQFYVEERARGWFCNLKMTKTKQGTDKYPQLDMGRFGLPHCQGKQLVHLIWWRWSNDGAPVSVTDDNQISHCDAEPGYLNLVQESKDMNESRKFCHKFKWYAPLPGETKPRCPHWETPCTGPL